MQLANRIYLLVIPCLMGLSNLAFSGEQECIDRAASIDEKLACISGLSFSEVVDQNTPEGARQFDLRFSQPIDHNVEKSATFNQRLVLIHRGENEPMVLQTSGYAIFGVRQAVVTSLFATNQLQVEHRFFADSVPAGSDWTKMDIKQSADDFHRISDAFHQIYKQPWINTGGSKGGMTSVFHRRFYPNDLDGTIADVAPLSYSTSDNRYVGFVENVGGFEWRQCREDLQKLQMALLQNRDELVPLIEGTFSTLGNADIAFEHAVIESSFIFWQYKSPTDATVGCDKIPVNGTPKEMFDYLQLINEISGYTDPDLGKFMPYYFQAATQLGNPNNSTPHLEHLRKYPFVIEQYTPKGVELSYSNESMIDVQNWVNNDSSKIIFIYGEYDPWTAGAYSVNPKSLDVKKYYVKRGNHASKFTALETEEKDQVINTISGWLGKKPVPVTEAMKAAESLEDFEFKMRKKFRL